MAIEIPVPLVEFILLGPSDDRRQLQDSPILGDVWIEYAKGPSAPVDLLITPYRTQHAGLVAEAVEKGMTGADARRANIAYLQGIVVARLTFGELLRVVVPLTKWWSDRWDKPRPGGDPGPDATRRQHAVYDYDPARVDRVIAAILASAKAWFARTGDAGGSDVLPLDRYLTLTGLLLWAAGQPPPDDAWAGMPTSQRIKHVLESVQAADIVGALGDMRASVAPEPDQEPLVWQVSLNRTASPALTRSVPAVKADAAHTLFKISCRDIAWAVIDSGVDGAHPAFGSADGTTRVERCFDFTAVRQIVSLSNASEAIRRDNVAALMERPGLRNPPANPGTDLERLAQDVRERRPIHWDLVQRFVELDPATRPFSNHGTHVAGIIGASREAANRAAGSAHEDHADGMCPDIQLYDFRVLGPSIKDTEFAIIAALQFIRYLNERDNFFTIHGANLSLSIRHDVRNFACGRTPICNECERLVDSGVVVVAAAGNHGYKSFETQEGAFESYAAFSITDPGNADSIITVGATHRYWPHTYGVSFFSSRGPTGDGRLKPDLVAPGERIRAPLPGGSSPGGDWGDLDGTSMAAPHVSGAAAMLMARYSELIGQPRRIKQILCDSATDLGRERSFQGHGMLDVLRAFQSV
jgi:subtilisin family serine protease